MTSLRFRLTLLTTLATALIVGLSYLAGNAYLQYEKLNQSFRQSYKLVEETKNLINAKFDKKVHARLQKARETLTPEHRMELLSNILQSYADRNQSLLAKRVDLFERNEIEYRKYIEPLMNYLSERLLYYSVICIFTMLTSLIGIYFYAIRTILRPLKGLSRKMVDFLNNRYTYQFSVPAPNEVGHLQATFNALAQRVLANLEDLKALDRAKSDFLSIASHELRTPLTSIKGSLSLLNSGVVGQFPETVTNLVSIAENETDRLIRLINDLLDLAKIEARKFPLQKKWSSLDALVNDTLQSMVGFAQTAKVKLVSTGDLNYAINMDRDRIQQVLTNLLSNAIKYSPEGGAVTVRCGLHEDQVLVEVIDQGRGIAPEDQDLIFERFRQATSPDNPLVKGTGLGLAIAKALVDEHNGKIGVHSKPGEGSTFYFTLPEWKTLEQLEYASKSMDEGAA